MPKSLVVNPSSPDVGDGSDENVGHKTRDDDTVSVEDNGSRCSENANQVHDDNNNSPESLRSSPSAYKPPSSSSESSDVEEDDEEPPQSQRSRNQNQAVRGVNKAVRMRQPTLSEASHPTSRSSTARVPVLTTADPLGRNRNKYRTTVTTEYARCFEIWQFGDVEKKYVLSRGQEKPGWRCKRCGHEYAGVNATKAYCHLAKVPNMNITSCSCVPQDVHKFYRDVYNARQGYLNEKKRTLEAFQKREHDQTQNAAADLETKRRRCSRAVSVSANSSLSTWTSAAKTPNGCDQGHVPGELNLAGSRNVFDHMTRPTPAQANSIATTAFCKLIFQNSLPFSIGESPAMKDLVNALRHVGPEYTLPPTNSIRTELLDKAIADHDQKIKKIVDEKKHISGFTIMGDMCTKNKRPMMNVLIRVPGYPPITAKILDCSSQLIKEGVKNAEFIVDVIRDVLDKYDPLREFLGLIIFD